MGIIFCVTFTFNSKDQAESYKTKKNWTELPLELGVSCGVDVQAFCACV